MPKDNIDTIGEELHGVCTDQGGNMVAGFRDFERGNCACHRLTNSLKTTFSILAVAGVIKKVSIIPVTANCISYAVANMFMP